MTSLALALILAAPHAQLQLYFQSTPANPAWQQKVYEKVSRAWTGPSVKDAPKPGQKTVVQVVVDQKGAIVSTVVSMESGAPKFDAAALAAVKRGAPYPAPPSSPAEFHVHVTWAP